MAVQRIEGENDLAVHGIEDNPKPRRRRNPGMAGKFTAVIGVPIVDLALGAVGAGFVYIVAKKVYDLVRPTASIYEKALVPAVIGGLGAYAVTRVNNAHAKHAGKVAIVVIAGLALAEVFEDYANKAGDKLVEMTGIKNILPAPAAKTKVKATAEQIAAGQADAEGYLKGYGSNMLLLRGGLHGQGYGRGMGDVLVRVGGQPRLAGLAGAMGMK
jgi:hypothetical protein